MLESNWKRALLLILQSHLARAGGYDCYRIKDWCVLFGTVSWWEPPELFIYLLPDERATFKNVKNIEWKLNQRVAVNGLGNKKWACEDGFKWEMMTSSSLHGERDEAAVGIGNIKLGRGYQERCGSSLFPPAFHHATQASNFSSRLVSF